MSLFSPGKVALDQADLSIWSYQWIVPCHRCMTIVNRPLVIESFVAPDVFQTGFLQTMMNNIQSSSFSAIYAASGWPSNSKNQSVLVP